VSDLRAAIVVDYQNDHLTGHGRFKSTKYGPKHEALIDPLFFAQQLLQVRNARQRDGRPNAVLRTVDVYRGSPAATTTPMHTPEISPRRPAGSATRGCPSLTVRFATGI
jgi:hypothetical protein